MNRTFWRAAALAATSFAAALTFGLTSSHTGPAAAPAASPVMFVPLADAAQPLHASTSHHAGRHIALTVPDNGVQDTCTRGQLGWTATITVAGTGDTFRAVCDADGPVDVWDAR
jgi:hypothetical protein